MTAERIIIEKMFKVADKDGRDVDFILNAEQAEFDTNLTGRDIVAKARQMGFSTYVLALFLARCLAYRNRRAVLISHDTTSTQKLLGRIHYMIKHMKGASPDLKYANQNYITFNKTDSSIYVGTAGAADIGVGDTISDLHCSEVSRWDNPGPLLSGLFQAVPTHGTIIMESTGRGMGNYFHRAVMQAKDNGEQGFKLHFFDWLTRPEYQLPCTPEEAAFIMANLNPVYEEEYYVKHFGLTAPQIKWRRRKIAELEYDLQQFKEQYPVDLNECFQATGSGFFQEINYEPSSDWVQIDPWVWKLREHPKVQHIYAAGADPAGGNGLDPSVLEIYDVETGEQVLEYSTKRLDPPQFAERCADLCRLYGAYFNFERNNHGYGFGAKLIEVYPKELINRTRRRQRNNERSEIEKLHDWGQYTSEISKPLIVGKFKTAHRVKDVTIFSNALKSEMLTFVEHTNGSLEAMTGCHDDLVMASALAREVFEKAAAHGNYAKKKERARRNPTTADIFSAGSLINELELKYANRGGSFPILSGVDNSV